jgi:outer membrane lipoprotein-sorting protein
MKIFLRFGFAAVALVLFFNAFAVTETKAQVLNDILKRMETHRQSLTSLRTNVTMVKYDSVLKVSDTIEGTSMYLPLKGRDALVRIDWTKPAQETLSVVKGQYIIYRPRLNQYLTGSTKDAKGSGKANGALSFMNMSKEQLKANYGIKYLGQENVSGGTLTVHLELTPKTAQSYKSAELWVDGNGMPIQAKIIEKNKDTTTVLLSNIKKNETINANAFNVKLPKGVQRIDG